MNKRRWMMMLALPLVLGVLLGAAKWKQLHPTATMFDLQERAFLKQAKFVRVTVEGEKVVVPSDEFKATLDDFYLTDVGNDWKSVIMKNTGHKRRSGPSIDIKIADELDNEFVPFAGIHIDKISFYVASHATRADAPQQQEMIMANLHPVTERRLRELIAKHRPAK